MDLKRRRSFSGEENEDFVRKLVREVNFKGQFCRVFYFTDKDGVYLHSSSFCSLDKTRSSQGFGFLLDKSLKFSISIFSSKLKIRQQANPVQRDVCCYLFDALGGVFSSKKNKKKQTTQNRRPQRCKQDLYLHVDHLSFTAEALVDWPRYICTLCRATASSPPKPDGRLAVDAAVELN